MSLIALAVIAAFAIYIMKPEERRRFVPRGLQRLPSVVGDPARFGLLVPAIAAINIIVYFSMATLSGGAGEAEMLVRWGGNYGPRTTNGEWSRLMTSTFVHGGPLHLLATLAGLLQAGVIVERLAGYVTFSAVYVVGGFLASAVSLWLHPVGVSVGASGAVFAIYGFLIATALWGILRPTGVKIPLHVVRSLLPGTALFVGYNVLSGGLTLDAEIAGCAAGFVSGLVLTRDIAERRPAAPRVLAAVAATFTIAAAIAVPLYGLADVRPEIERVVLVENNTAAQYMRAVVRFKTGALSAKDLARVIDRNIVPELQAARTHLSGIGRVPQEQEALVSQAGAFLTLREESWRVRASGLEARNMAALRKADVIELTSRQQLDEMLSVNH
jgi:membrane associated rhomboid family serine protease